MNRHSEPFCSGVLIVRINECIPRSLITCIVVARYTYSILRKCVFVIDFHVFFYCILQARALTAQTAETDAIRFIVGTQSLKFDNQVRKSFISDTLFRWKDVVNKVTS